MKKNTTLNTPDREASGARTDPSLMAHTPLSIETRADRQILERLIKSFDSEVPTMDVSAISFFVRNRAVTINGIIRDQADRQLLVSIVKKTAGVERVIDRLRIAPERFRSRIFRRSA